MSGKFSLLPKTVVESPSVTLCEPVRCSPLTSGGVSVLYWNGGMLNGDDVLWPTAHEFATLHSCWMGTNAVDLGWPTEGASVRPRGSDDDAKQASA